MSNAHPPTARTMLAEACEPDADQPQPAGPPSRLSAAQACTLIAFPAMGSVLYSTGTPLSVIFELLGGCGGIGATACAAACGGRRLIVMLSEAALRAAASK